MKPEGVPARAVKPVVVVSQCLGFAAVRYNGLMLQDEFVQGLRQHVRFVQVCPEVGIGLGVPRDPIRIVVGPEGRWLIQPSTNRDLTELMRKFAADFLEQAGPVDGFILKSRSPSCGIKDVKTFADSAANAPLQKGSGFFGEAVLAKFPRAAIEDEGRLSNFRLRHHFLVHLFANARWREVERRGTMRALVQFHTEYKLQWMAYSQTGLNGLGRIVANARQLPTDQVLSTYAAGLGQLLAQPARPGPVRNALLHAFGYVSAGLAASERRHFLELLKEYQHGRLPVSALLTLLQSWVLRFQQAYLAGQKFFEPYPRALMDLSDLGKGAP